MQQPKYFLYLFLIFFVGSLKNSAQNTVGVIENSTDVFNGYTLFTVYKETYLINNCGEVINQWSSNYIDGKSVYLLEDGSILRAGTIDNSNFLLPGIGGVVQKFDWDGNLTWEYNYSTSEYTQHHDISPLPNGNVLLLVATIKDGAEALAAGRDPSLLPDAELYNEQIIEVTQTGPTTGTIVWKWNVWDHLIQDFDNTKTNFGVVSNNPQLLNINFLGNSGGKANWLHSNSMQYYDDLNQIVLSSRLLNEFYIIDHSTTAAEATLHTGGNYGKGGDILYRWGNPQSYNQGISTDQKLFGQHYPHFIPSGLVDAGKIMIYNNGFGRAPTYSEINIIAPQTDSPGVYSYVSNTAYGPLATDYTYTDPIDQTNFYSAILSSAQRLPNGNTLICEGASGLFFEIDPSENIVWKYINPQDGTGTVFNQGDSPSGNRTFRATKYAPNYVGFSGKDLTPGSTIEAYLPPFVDNCTPLDIVDNVITNYRLFPNPTKNILIIKTPNTVEKIEVYTALGQLVITNHNSKNVDLRTLSRGLYLLKIHSNNKIISEKIIKN